MWKKLTKMSVLGMVALTLFVHALLTASLIGFGLRSDGWVLHPVSVAWYGLFVLGGLGMLYVGRTEGGADWLLVIPPLLTLAAVGAFPVTGALGGARYAPYDTGDLHEIFVGMHLTAGFAMVALALLYRRPRLLLAWAVGQGALLISYPAWWARLWRWGALGDPLPTLALVAGLPLLYALALGALGGHLPRCWSRRVRAGLAIGVALIGVAAFRQVIYIRSRAVIPSASAGMTLEFMLGALLLLAFGGLFAPLPLLAWEKLRSERAGGARRFPWEMLVLLLLVATSTLFRFVQPSPDGMLPAAGGVQAWRSPDHIVPDAWWPPLAWTGWLLQAVRWLLIPYILVHLLSMVQREEQPPISTSISAATGNLFALPHVLLGAGLLWLAVLAVSSRRLGFPLQVVGLYPHQLCGSAVVLGAMTLLLAGRALEQAERVWLRWVWRWLALSALLGLLVWAGRGAWHYGRLLVAPLPAWTAVEQWQYVPLPRVPLPLSVWGLRLFLMKLSCHMKLGYHLPPLPRVPLSALGLALYLLLVGWGLSALLRSVAAWFPLPRQERAGPTGLRPVLLPVFVVVGIAGLSWWWRTPRVVQTAPPDGAVDVPRTAAVSVQMRERTWLWRLLGHSGFGISAHYADTGAYIPGMSGGSRSSFRFEPEAPLRPGAPVKVTVHRTGERPYTLRFTTAPSSE